MLVSGRVSKNSHTSGILVLLMVFRNPANQLRLVVLSVYPMAFTRLFFYIFGGFFSLDFRTINSIESPTVREVDFKKNPATEADQVTRICGFG